MDNPKLVPLTKGKFAIVDSEDFPIVSRYKWYAFHSKGIYYAARKAGLADTEYLYREVIFMHKYLMDTTVMVDHIDRNSLNNTKANLRLCNYFQNAQNTGPKAGEYKGVWFDKDRGNYQVKCGRVHLGRHSSAEGAAKVYDNYAIEEYGEFAYLNFPVVGGYHR